MAMLVTVSPIGNWAESSCSISVCDGVVHCPMSASLQMSCIHLCSFAERNCFTYDFLHWQLAGQHVLADVVSSVEGG